MTDFTITVTVGSMDLEPESVVSKHCDELWAALRREFPRADVKVIVPTRGASGGQRVDISPDLDDAKDDEVRERINRIADEVWGSRKSLGMGAILR